MRDRAPWQRCHTAVLLSFFATFIGCIERVNGSVRIIPIVERLGWPGTKVLHW